MNATPSVDFICGRIVGAAHAVLTAHMWSAQPGDPIEEQFWQAQYSYACVELKRLVQSTFQTHGNEMGDSVQLAALILLLVGEQHDALTPVGVRM